MLRVALEEADDDPRGLSLTLHYITTARGGIDDLGLRLEEKTAWLSALGKHFAPEPMSQAALMNRTNCEAGSQGESKRSELLRKKKKGMRHLFVA